VSRGTRILLRLLTLVLSLSVVVFIGVAAFTYVWQTAEANSPKIALSFRTADIDQAIDKGAALLQLRLTGVDPSQPADPDDDTPVPFVIEEGQSVTAVGAALERHGLVADGDAFRYYLQSKGSDRSIQAGVFTLRRNMTMDNIIAELQHGELPSSLVTIPEGWRAEQVAALLEENNITPAAEFLQAVEMGRDDYPFLTDRPEGASHSLEGFLFPDTYQLPKHTQPQVVLDILLDNWQARVGDELLAKAADSGLSIYELVTLASVVEREAVLDGERALIARVYLNRLAIDMPLQADPTVQFAKGYDAVNATWWPKLLRDELNAVVSPYNTYLNPGLPPGPICSPGLASLQGAIEPAAPGTPFADALYFVAVADDKVPLVPPAQTAHLEEPTPGMHLFSTTFEEHAQNDALYGER
jgi:UPF0755 protein